MTENELSEIISKYQMPEDRYLVEEEGLLVRVSFSGLSKISLLIKNTY